MWLWVACAVSNGRTERQRAGARARGTARVRRLGQPAGSGLPQGLLHSRVFPGLRLPVAPLLAGDTAKVLAALAQNEMPMGKQSENSVVNEDPFTTGK